MGQQQQLRTTTLVPQPQPQLQLQIQIQLQLQPTTIQIIKYLILQGLLNLLMRIPTAIPLSPLQIIRIQIQIQL